MQDNVEAVARPILFAVLLGSAMVWAAVARRFARGQPPLDFEPRMRVTWSGLDMVVLGITFLSCEVVAATLAARMTGASADGMSAESLLAASIARLIWLAFAVVYLVFKAGAYLDDLGFDTSRPGRDARLGGLTFLAAIVPVYAIQLFFVYVVKIPSEHPVLRLTQQQPSVWILALATVAAVGVAPLFEEFVFRVVLQGWLESQQVRLRRLRGAGYDEKPGFAPIVIASAVFAMLHLGHGPDPFALFVLSLFLGYAYRQTHRIGPPLLIHFGVNALAMINVWVLFLAAP
jgi:membrane protease YdiL (CAAX protease family)